jgi:hypothetical protein
MFSSGWQGSERFGGDAKHRLVQGVGDHDIHLFASEGGEQRDRRDGHDDLNVGLVSRQHVSQALQFANVVFHGEDLSFEQCGRHLPGNPREIRAVVLELPDLNARGGENQDVRFTKRFRQAPLGPLANAGHVEENALADAVAAVLALPPLFGGHVRRPGLFDEIVVALLAKAFPHAHGEAVARGRDPRAAVDQRSLVRAIAHRVEVFPLHVLAFARGPVTMTADLRRDKAIAGTVLGNFQHMRVHFAPS